MLSPGETVRLLRAVPEAGLQQDQECEVLRVLHAEEARPDSVEVKFYAGDGTCTAVLPSDAVEAVLSTRTEQRTAVLWGVAKGPRELVHGSLHALMNQGLAMAEGLNLARLYYDRQERWWKR